nr:SMC-Scp complex subunit ScpB [Propionibacterium sp.]
MTADVSGALEALLLMATEPMSVAELAQALDVPKPVVHDALDGLRRFYDETDRGFELREVGRGWRYYTRSEHHEVIARWVLDGQHGRLSQAALETLAVVAYLQPISRSRVSAVRGVNVDGVIRTLATRDLIEEAGRDPDTGAVLFRTTDYFCERLGITSLADLPPLAPHLPEATALEAELAGLAGRAELHEDVPMPESNPQPEAQRDEPEIPSADEVAAWSQHGPGDARPASPPVIPDAGELDRLSDPE